MSQDPYTKRKCICERSAEGPPRQMPPSSRGAAAGTKPGTGRQKWMLAVSPGKDEARRGEPALEGLHG